MTRETWYLMDDGTAGDPREIATGADGRPRHKDGRACAHPPRGIGVDAEAERGKAPLAAKAPRARRGREMTAGDDGPGYQTRAAKAD